MNSLYINNILKGALYVISLMIAFNNFSYSQARITHSEKNFIHKNYFSNREDLSPKIIEQLNNYDIKSYTLDLNVSSYSTEIDGNGTIYAKVQNDPLDTFVVELIDSLAENTYMIVDSVEVNGQILNHIHAGQLIKVALNPPLPINSYLTSTIYYHGNGEATYVTGYNGLGTGSAFNSSVTRSYSEPFWSKVWFPCKQILNDKIDSVHIFITTSSDCKAGSNGILKSIVQLPNNKVRYEWKSNYPIAYYLISFSVGQYIEKITYAKIEGLSDSILIQSYLFQSCPYLPMQMIAIEKTKDFMQLFSNLFGNYPFAEEKYGYCLDTGPWGAMEHQTMTTIGYQALDTTAAFVFNYYFWYSAHELAHSWFGDNVTCASWQDIWVNEGFAAYGEYLALQSLESQSRADFWMNNAHQTIKQLPGGSVFVPYQYVNDQNRIFDYRLTYKKGAAIVHTLRFEVGNDSIFFLSLRNFQNEFKDSVATGLDFKNVLELTTGQDFTDFFNQWYFGEGYPIYNISWIQVNDTLKIHSVQSTSTSVTPLFKMPVELKLQLSAGDTLIRIYQNSNEQYFEFYFPQLISGILIDPNNWIIDNSIVIHTDVRIEETLLKTFQLYQNYPNPFNPYTTIKYSVPQTSQVQINVFDILGNEIKTLVNEEKSVGIYEVKFIAEGVPSGIYFYKLRSGSFVETKKIILLK